MDGIKMSDCKFYVNEEARTVVCVIPNTSDMVIDYIWEHFQWKDINVYESLEYGKFRNSIKMPNSFMGKATCAVEDEWDEDLGRIIAFSRAKDKCYKSFFKRANRVVQALDSRLGDMITVFNDFGTKLEAKKDALNKIIESRVQKE